MNELPLLRFIPFRRRDILNMCLADQNLDAIARVRMQQAWKIIEDHFRAEFADIKGRLKDIYGPLDPDADTRTVTCSLEQDTRSENLGAAIEEILRRANYEKATPEAVQRAFDAESLFHIKLYVDFADFEDVLLYYRGTTPAQEQVSHWFGLRKKTVSFTLLERVVIYIQFKRDIDVESTLGGCRPGSTMLKLFQNVPDADVEMLFPNTRVGMRGIDKLMIGIPALISGGLTVSTKLGTMLVLLGSFFGFWMGLYSEPVEMGRAEVLVLLAGLVALSAYFWKQLSSFRKRKLKYTEALTRNLYFKLLDNNAGVMFRVLDDAEDAECKESLLAYSFLLQAGTAMTAAELDKKIESWLATQWNCRLDFEIADALEKLRRLELAVTDGVSWQLPEWRS